MIRQSAVAGYFYQGTADSLKRQVEEFIIPDTARVRAMGILVPHAGLMYSGSVAGAVYSRVELPDTFILIGPNHTGLGAPVSLMAFGQWETPLGIVDVDEDLAGKLLAGSRLIQEDTLAHLQEHSLEVQLPFIQYFKKKFSIVPIQMLDIRLETCLELGRAVAEAIKGRRAQSAEGRGQANEQRTRDRSQESEVRSQKTNNVLIVASSDMSHYVSAETAKEKDFKAIDRILSLDPEGLHRTIREYGITMCGFGPATAMLHACKILGAKKAELIKYSNSGEVSGDYEKVVGYAGIAVM